MSKVKYYYDHDTLSYREIKVTNKNRISGVLLFLLASFFFGITSLLILLNFEIINTPSEVAQKRSIENFKLQFDILNKKLGQLEKVIANIENRDNNLYRVYFEASPIPEEQRLAGFGGINRYKDLEGYDNSDLIINTTKRLDILTKQTVVQSRSLEEIESLAKNKASLIEAIPTIQPIKNKDLTRVASGYGYRIDPFTKIRRFHYGMDFTAKRGTPIYATGNGVVVRTQKLRTGYGQNVIIDHGYGYRSLYAHMSKILVKRGQKVKRGEVIGKVYVSRHFKPEAKTRMVELVENLRKAYGKGIDDLEWMSADTKIAAKDKLAKFIPKIGYPDQWRDYSALSIKEGDLVLMDMGAEYHCYAADITTTVPAGGKFTPDAKIIYEGVLAAHQAVLKALKPGCAWLDLQRLAETHILRALVDGGFLVGDIDEMMAKRVSATFMPHGLGHHLGVDTHDVGGYGLPGTPARSTEPGLKNCRTASLMKEGNVMTIEPGCYFIDVLLDRALRGPYYSIAKLGGRFPTRCSATTPCRQPWPRRRGPTHCHHVDAMQNCVGSGDCCGGRGRPDVTAAAASTDHKHTGAGRETGRPAPPQDARALRRRRGPQYTPKK